MIKNVNVCVDLWDPQGTADVDPLGAAPRRLHGSALLGAQLALRQDAQGADPAQPASLWHFLDTVTRLVRNTNRGGGSAARPQVEINTVATNEDTEKACACNIKPQLQLI